MFPEQSFILGSCMGKIYSVDTNISGCGGGDYPPQEFPQKREGEALGRSGIIENS